MIIWAGLAAIGLSFFLAAMATPLSRRVALRFGMLDMPQRHKAHAEPVPLLGGCAIFAAVAGPCLLALALARFWSVVGIPAWLPEQFAPYVRGIAERTPAALGILAAAAVLHVVGIIDDRKNLGAWLKLAAQAVVCTAVVLLCDVRVLTALGEPYSSIISVLWLVAITNAFNFMDNMDGLAAGVAAICTAVLVAASASVGQLFVPAMGCLLLGALLGFLIYNFPPASTFMGDAGSLVIGFLLGVLSCRTTYVQADQTYYTYGVFVPLVLMAVPLYDMASVLLLRVRERRNPMVGDRRHFSHRLVRRGMRPRTAVLTIYLCTGATAVAATLLPQIKTAAGAALVFAQTLAILALVALLEWGDSKQ